MANELQCKSYSKLEDAIKDNYYDLVVVATPDHEHFEQICQLVLSKNPPKVIFSEKPVCMNPTQLKKLKNLIASHDVQLLINHSRRIDPNYINLKKEISSRFLGGVTFVNAYYYNGWMHNGVHTVDTLLYLFGEVIKWKKCWYAHPSDYIDDLSLNALGTLTRSRAPINIFAFEEKYFQLLEFDLFFSQGRIRLHDFGHQCSMEIRTQNASGENVLEEKDQLLFNKDTISPLNHAYSAILNYLQTTILRKFGFSILGCH